MSSALRLCAVVKSSALALATPAVVFAVPAVLCAALAAEIVAFAVPCAFVAAVVAVSALMLAALAVLAAFSAITIAAVTAGMRTELIAPMTLTQSSEVQTARMEERVSIEGK